MADITSRENYLKVAYYLLSTSPEALEKYIIKEYSGGLVCAIQDNYKILKEQLQEEQLALVDQILGLSQQCLFEHYDYIVNNTVLDNTVLDNLITKCAMTIDDRHEVFKHARTSDRNRTILDILLRRGSTTFQALIEALKSDDHYKDLAETLGGIEIKEKSVNTDTNVGEFSVRLQKKYHRLIKNISSVSVSTILDILVQNDVLEIDDSAEISSITNLSEMNRKLIEKIRDENAYNKFLAALREDCINAELADELEATEVTESELQLLKTARSSHDHGTKLGIDTMIVLASVISKITIPSEPAKDDITLGADLYRLQSYTDFVVKKDEICDELFQEMMTVLSSISYRLSGRVNEDNLTTGLGADGIAELTDKLLKLKEKATIIRLSSKVEEFDDSIPKHIRDTFNEYIDDWREEDRKFVVTSATKHIAVQLKTSNCVVVTGSSGTGKSSSIHHIALELHQDHKFEIIPYILEPGDILQYYNKKRRQVFVIDDICGKVAVDVEHVNKWTRYLKQIERFFQPNQTEPQYEDESKVTFSLDEGISQHKLLISCRLHIFKDQQFQRLKIFTKYECNLMSETFLLSQEERTKMIKNYTEDKNVNNVQSLLDAGGNFVFFPLLCKLSANKSKEELAILFSKPVESLREDIKEIERNNVLQYCCIALCVLCGCFKEEWLKLKATPSDVKLLLDDVFSEHNIQWMKGKPKRKIKESMTSLLGTYLKRIGNDISLIHDKIYDIAAVICGEDLLECFITHAQSTFIGDRYMFASTKAEPCDNVIIVPEDTEEEYFERLVKDLKNRDIYSTLHNKQCAFDSYRKNLLNYFTKKIELITSLFKEIEQKGIKRHIQKNDQQDFEVTPLMEAASEGYPDIVNFLIEIKCDMNRTDSKGRSPLHVACEGGHASVVELFLRKYGVVSKCDKYGQSPMYLACLGGHINVVEILLQNNANTFTCDNNGRSPLYAACETGHTSVVEILLAHNADMSQRDKYGKSPLYMACMEGYTAIVKLFLENGAFVNEYDENRRSLLHLACMKKNTELVELLLQHNTKIKYDKWGRSPMYVACVTGDETIVKLFLKYTPFIYRCTKSGESSLHVACAGGHLHITKILLKAGANISKGNKSGESPFNLACAGGHIDIVKLLRKKKAGTFKCDNWGETPLYRACAGGLMYLSAITGVSRHYMQLVFQDVQI